MAKLKLIMNKGLPASGKSTNAKLLTQGGYYRVNKDDIRAMLFGENYKKKHEKQVIWTRDAMIREALGHGKSVVVDDTNLNPIHEKALKKIAEEFKADFEVNDSFLKVPLDECIRRDLKRSNPVGERVIRDMYHQWIMKPEIAPEYDESLPYVILSDIDGTLAHMTTRKRFGDKAPYAWKYVGEDEVDAGVAFLIDAVAETHRADVILFSGRDEICRPETEDWLERNDIAYKALYMRRSDHVDVKGGQVKDTLVKKEMYEKYIKGKYNVLGIFDDRPSVCRMWREELGLRVFQLGDPHYEF